VEINLESSLIVSLGKVFNEIFSTFKWLEDWYVVTGGSLLTRKPKRSLCCLLVAVP